MKAKQYMLQIRKIDNLISNKNQERIKWLEMAESITAEIKPVAVSSSGNKQKMETAIVNYLSEEEEIKHEIFELMNRKKEIIRTIEVLPANEYDVLHLYYIQKKEFQEIADIKNRSYSWVTSIHGIALKSLQKVLDERDQ